MGGGDSQAESLIFAPGVCAAAVALSLSEDWLTESMTKVSEYELCALTKAVIVSNLYCISQVCEIVGNTGSSQPKDVLRLQKHKYYNVEYPLK